MQTRRKWTKEDEIKLIQLFDRGDPLSEIADTLSRTVISCRSRLEQLRISGRIVSKRQPGYSQEEEEKIIELFSEHPFKESVKYYNRWAKQQGYQTRSSSALSSKVKSCVKQKKLRIDRTAEYLTTADISLIFGIHRSNALHLVQRFKSDLKPKWANQENGTLLVSIESFSRWLRSEDGVFYLKRFWLQLDVEYVLFLLKIIQ